MAKTAKDAKKKGKSLSWWRLSKTGISSEKESAAALTVCHPDYWLNAHCDPLFTEKAKEQATFCAIPSAMIAAALSADCDLAMLIPICLIARLRSKRASFSISKSQIAKFLRISEKTVYNQLRKYDKAGILRVTGNQSGKSMQITVCAQNRSELIELAYNCAHGFLNYGEALIPIPTKRHPAGAGMLPVARAGKKGKSSERSQVVSGRLLPGLAGNLYPPRR